MLVLEHMHYVVTLHGTCGEALNVMGEYPLPSAAFDRDLPEPGPDNSLDRLTEMYMGTMSLSIALRNFFFLDQEGKNSRVLSFIARGVFPYRYEIWKEPILCIPSSPYSRSTCQDHNKELT